jgi:hypothetical protein
MPRPLIKTTRGWRDKTMVDHEGVPLGRITHIYMEEVTGEPEWAPVATGEDRRVFVPLVDATERGGPAARLRQGLVWTRERVLSPAGGGSWRTRLLLAAGAAVSSLAGGLLLARRRRRERPSGLAGAIGGAVGSVLAVPAGALRRRRLRALAGTAAAPLAAAGRAVARASRRGRHRTRTPQPRTPRNSRTRMADNLKLLAGLVDGYVLGARGWPRTLRADCRGHPPAGRGRPGSWRGPRRDRVATVPGRRGGGERPGR